MESNRKEPTPPPVETKLKNDGYALVIETVGAAFEIAPPAHIDYNGIAYVRETDRDDVEAQARALLQTIDAARHDKAGGEPGPWFGKFKEVREETRWRPFVQQHYARWPELADSADRLQYALDRERD